jgi:hypothetical protein
MITLLKCAGMIMADEGDKQHHTAKTGEVKSHPRFHALNLHDALARRALARA